MLAYALLVLLPILGHVRPEDLPLEGQRDFFPFGIVSSNGSISYQPVRDDFGNLLIEGDIALRKEEEEIFESRGGNGLIWKEQCTGMWWWKKCVKSRQWPRVIPYFIESSSSGDAAVIRNGLNHITQKVGCLRFQQVSRGDGKNPFLSFHKASGCWSGVGMDTVYKATGQKISIGPGCESIATVVHETMHALGVNHEQGRFDRDNYVQIMFQNVKPGMEYNFKKASSSEYSNYGISYDFASVMHYGRCGFSKRTWFDRQKWKYDCDPTIVAKPQYGNPDFGNEQGMTAKDQQLVKKMYCT